MTDREQLPAMKRRRFHQIVFLIAGFYNMGWGLYAAIDPQWLFRYAHMPLQNYPQMFACIGMIVGVYGVLYWNVARRPEESWLLAAIGFLGKFLGPIGMLQLILTGQWPLLPSSCASPTILSGGYRFFCICMTRGRTSGKIFAHVLCGDRKPEATS